MLITPATRYKRLIVNDPGTVLENGVPLIVHGMLFSDVTDNAQLLIYNRNGTVQIMAPYVDNFFGGCPSNEFMAPFLAPDGLLLYGVTTFGTPGIGAGTNVDVTIFYSHVGG